MKYVVFTHPTKGDMLFAFSREIDHDRMAEAVTAVRFGGDRNWNREFFRATPISAGFIDNGKCHGHSETLKLKSRGDADTKLLAALATPSVQQAAPQAVPLTEDDVYTLLGHAAVIGGTDMPSYFRDLAARIARTRGDEAAALRCEEVQRVAHGIGLETKE